ncbi:hypothetical protein LUX01_22075 [Streptomyces sudanensis]|uniref:FAD-dependent oxidoreductase n=1 Tax=Streptomyces sudanensis TaxID=436397 RepID=UPI0020CD5AF9|nr:FAD-dependent oxidoreductase [Streptomyces sudanensis]MCP9988935.1 hypothetical protein [Streptomyces sudanensis]
MSVVRAADGYGDGSHLLTRTESPHVWSVRGWNGGGVKTAPEAGRRIAELHVSDELTTRI